MNSIKLFLITCLIWILWGTLCIASIIIEPKNINLGNVLAGKPIDYTFIVKNSGNKVVNIKNITPD